MAEYILRKAGRRDALAIRRLILDVRINPLDLDWRRFLVAADEYGHLQGCGQIKPHNDGSLELASIAVRPDARGMGIARAIITELVRQEPSRPLYLICRSSLIEFYGKFGFQGIETLALPVYFQRIRRLSRLFVKQGEGHEGLLIMRLD